MPSAYHSDRTQVRDSGPDVALQGVDYRCPGFQVPRHPLEVGIVVQRPCQRRPPSEHGGGLRVRLLRDRIEFILPDLQEMRFRLRHVELLEERVEVRLGPWCVSQDASAGGLVAELV